VDRETACGKGRTSPVLLGSGPTGSGICADRRLGFSALSARFPRMTTYTPAQLERTREDLAYIVRFIAAARQVDDLAVFIEFLDWLAELLLARGVPIAALVGGLEVLEPCCGTTRLPPRSHSQGWVTWARRGPTLSPRRGTIAAVRGTCLCTVARVSLRIREGAAPVVPTQARLTLRPRPGERA